MPRIITLLICLVAAFASTAYASGTPVHCIRDGDHARCAWSMSQAVEPLIAPVDPKAQPVPLCLDCEPLEIELTCALVRDGDRAAVVRCEGNSIDRLD